jgi:hypothetical protein
MSSRILNTNLIVNTSLELKKKALANRIRANKMNKNCFFPESDDESDDEAEAEADVEAETSDPFINDNEFEELPPMELGLNPGEQITTSRKKQRTDRYVPTEHPTEQVEHGHMSKTDESNEFEDSDIDEIGEYDTTDPFVNDNEFEELPPMKLGLRPKEQITTTRKIKRTDRYVPTEQVEHGPDEDKAESEAESESESEHDSESEYEYDSEYDSE